MSKALVIFASKGDASVYDPIIAGLKKEQVEHDFHVCSVHRTPEELDKLLKGKYGFVISGAGLSAALPGAIAAKLSKPVIGVPIAGNYEGLDALLSIMQMPPGIPVLSVGVGQVTSVVHAAKKLQGAFTEVNIVSKAHSRAQEKADGVLRELDIIHKTSDAVEKGAINIAFISLDEEIPESEELVIYCPLLLEQDDKAEAALNVLKHSSHGMWVGLNNGMNAALAAVQILNKDGKYDAMLAEYKQKKKVVK